ncbi:MAG: hypothetical protein HKN16_07715, partial [Saprospiraceae bacterium]|nr:hypothetical protein [Saprospiraceae bacterium]
AFNGDFNLLDTPDNILHIKWENLNESAELIVDLEKMKMDIEYTEAGGVTVLDTSIVSK